MKLLSLARYYSALPTSWFLQRCFFSVILCLLSFNVFAHADSRREEGLKGAVQLPFIQNREQISKDRRILFFGQAAGYDVRVARTGIEYVVHGRNSPQSWSIRETLVGVSDFHISGENVSPTRVSFFLGRNASTWASNSPSYTSVSLGEPVTGVHLSLRLAEGVAEKIIYLDSGKQVQQLRFSVHGAESLEIGKKGQLLLKRKSDSVHFSAPVAFQETGEKRIAVDVAYRLTGKNEYGFILGKYDSSLPVTIDPGLVASTYLGGDGTNDRGDDVKLDANGNVYVVGSISLPYGTSYDGSFPTLPSSYDNSYNGSTDVFIAKFDPDLKTLLAVTFLGGQVATGETHCR